MSEIDDLIRKALDAMTLRCKTCETTVPFRPLSNDLKIEIVQADEKYLLNIRTRSKYGLSCLGNGEHQLVTRSNIIV